MTRTEKAHFVRRQIERDKARMLQRSGSSRVVDDTEEVRTRRKTVPEASGTNEKLQKRKRSAR